MTAFPGNSNSGMDWIRPYFPRLYYTVAGGVRDWFDGVAGFPRLAIAQTGRSRPNVIYDLMAQRAREAFVDIPNQVAVDEAYETILIRFLEQEVEMKLNKMDEDLRVHPPRTNRAAGFFQANLFGAPATEAEGVKLFAGYQLNVTSTELVRVAITCQHEDRVVWHSDIPEPPEGHMFSVPPLPPSIGPATGVEIA